MNTVGWIADFMGSIIGKPRLTRLQADLNHGQIRFGRHVLRPDRRQLFREGELVALNGKAFDLLMAFVESDGRILSREDLYVRLWGERIVEDANLSQTIYVLRRALDPDGDGRGFIETVPRVGYRFTQPLNRGVAPSSPRLAFAPVAAVLCLLALIGGTALSIGRPRTSIPSVARNDDDLGDYHLALRSPEHLAYALDYFQRAEKIAPGDAFAYAGAAAADALLAEFQADGSSRQRALVSRAAASIAQALVRDPHLSRAFAVRGFIAYRFEGDNSGAGRDLQRALAADPNDAAAHLWNGVLLMRAGNLADATSEFEEAHRLAPTSEIYSRWLARAYAFDGRPEEAIAEARETLRIQPSDAPAMLVIAGAQEQCGDIKAAIGTLRTLARQDPYERPFVVPDVARLEVRLGTAEASLVANHIGALALSGRADPFETALLYFTAGRAAAGRQMLRLAGRSSLAIQRHDPRLLALL